MQRRVFLVPVPLNVLPPAVGGDTVGVDIDPSLSSQLEGWTVEGVDTAMQLDGSLLLTILVARA